MATKTAAKKVSNVAPTGKPPVVRRTEPTVQVVEPKTGKVFDVATRNAYDLVNHQGWKLAQTPEEEVNDAAHSPRAEKKKRTDGLPKGIAKDRNAHLKRVPNGDKAPVGAGPLVDPDRGDNSPVIDAPLDDAEEDADVDDDAE